MVDAGAVLGYEFDGYAATVVVVVEVKGPVRVAVVDAAYVELLADVDEIADVVEADFVGGHDVSPVLRCRGGVRW